MVLCFLTTTLAVAALLTCSFVGKPIKHLPEQTYVKLEDNAHDLYLRIAAKSRFPINRLRITKASDGAAIPNARDVSVEDIGLFDQSSIFVKDLGRFCSDSIIAISTDNMFQDHK